MSPARRPARGGARGGGARKRKSGRGAGIALALLGVVAAGLSALAIYLGFVPGPESWLGRGGGRAPDPMLDSAAARAQGVAPTADTLLGAPAADSATTPVAAAANTVSAADSAAGDAVYRGAGRCVGCHGANGEGVAGLGSSLREPRLGDGSLASIARIVGGGAPPTPRYRIAMPAYGGQLASDDVARVSAYVFALAHPGATTADTTAVPGAGAPVGGPVAGPTPGAAATVPPDGAVNADAAPTTARPPAARPIRPTVPPPPAPAAASPTRRP